MRITELNIPGHICEPVGLRPVKMSRLDKLVVVAGPNGAGKTRLLNLIKRIYDEFKGSDVAAKLNLLTLKEENESLQTQLNTGNLHSEDKEYYQEKLAVNLASLADITNRHPILHWSIEPEWVKQGVVAFFPKSTSIGDTYTMSQQQVDQDNADTIGTDHMEWKTPIQILNITRRYIAAITPHEGKKIDEKEIQKCITEYQNLSSLMEQLLGAPLSFDNDLHPTIFGKRIGVANLSAGQTILLQLCVALYMQGSKLDNLILLIDEPENHLYPRAQLDALDKIIEKIGDGQVWVTTHSVHVLAHFDPSCIWYIDNGNIHYAGNIPNTVLNGLLGSEEEKLRLASFLSLPEEMAFNQFSFECLKHPKVLLTGDKDPQANQAHQILSQRIQRDNPVRVMDFGIGQGRLLATIYELEKQAGRSLPQWLDYFGYDVSDTYKEDCIRLFNNIYTTNQPRYFNNISKVMATLDKGDFDLVIMCNVLHEIDPKDWITIFKSTDAISSLLKPTGHLLIIEDQLLPVGEMAHSNGFLVLDSSQLKSLFNVKSSDGYHCIDYDGKGRLKAHFIPAPYIIKIDEKSRKEAILSVRDAALEQIKRIRQLKDRSFQQGRLLAFWTQQLANATLTLNELS